MDGTAQVVLLPLQQVMAISTVRVFIHKDLRPPENCQHGIKVHTEKDKHGLGKIWALR